MTPRHVFASALLIAAAAGQAATTTYTSAASVSQPWLSIATDPRSSAMGGAFVAVADSVHAMRSNPAGLGQIFEPELAFTHNEWNSSLGMRQEYLAFARRAGEGAFGLSLNYFSYGSFENRDSSGALLDASTDQSYAGSVAYASDFMGERLRLGFELEGAQLALGNSTQTMTTAGLGGLYQWYPSLRLGASMLNIGLSSDAGDAPTAMRFGFDWLPFHQALQLSSEYLKPSNGDASLRFGAEWNFLEAYSLRAGWRNGSDDSLDSGFSAGAGVKFGDFRIDYAFVPYGELSRAHRVGLTLTLSEGLFGSKIVIESYGQTQNAAAEFAEGMQAFQSHDWYLAKVSLSRALRLYPNFAKADVAKNALAEIDKKIAADKSRGTSAESRKKIAAEVDEARRLRDKGEIVKAKKKLEAVLAFDDSFKEAVALLKGINASLAERTGSLKAEAIAALSQGDLRTAVRKYRGVLKVDEEDPEARGRLAKLRPRISQETKKMHREGIDAYVTADIDKAISIWTDALDLDPSDPNGIKRDLDKAKKIMDLRSNN